MLIYIIKKKSYLILGIKKGPNIKKNISNNLLHIGHIDVTSLFHIDYSDYRDRLIHGPQVARML